MVTTTQLSAATFGGVQSDAPSKAVIKSVMVRLTWNIAIPPVVSSGRYRPNRNTPTSGRAENGSERPDVTENPPSVG